MNIYEQKKKQFLDWDKKIDAPLGSPWALARFFMDKTGYFEAPASTKFHLSVKGGLLIHSVCVTQLALQMAEHMPVDYGYTNILKAGLLHDIGKCGFVDCGGKHWPRYVPTEGFTYRTKWKHPYEYKDSTPSFNIRDLSALLVAKWGFPWDIVQAVLIHDGAYTESNKDYMGRNCPLAGLIMAADTMHAQQFETIDGIIPFKEK